MASTSRPVPLSGKQFTITAGDHSATIVEVGAGLRRYAVGDVDVTGTYGADELPPKGCGITLVPWPNRIRDGRYTFAGQTQQLALTEPDKHNAIHGLGRWARWTKVRQTPEQIGLQLDVVPQKGYPFQIRATVTYSIDSARGLRVDLAAQNTGSTAAPFGAGSHPYLATRGRPLDEVHLRIPARDALVVDELQVPVGVRDLRGKDDYRRGRRLRHNRFDDGFTDLVYEDGIGSAEVRTKAGGAQLWFDEAFRYLQVYTLDALTEGQSAIAIEPMTCAPDAFNSGNGLIVLEPGQQWAGSWGIAPS